MIRTKVDLSVVWHLSPALLEILMGLLYRIKASLCFFHCASVSDMICFTWRGGHRNALPHVLSCLFFNYRCTSKGIIQMLLRMAIWLWMLPMDSPQLSLFLRQHCDSTMSSLFWRHFSNSFALFELYIFYTSNKYLHIQDVSLFGFFFLPTSLNDFKL